jgi:hypothetical protein
MAAAAGTFAAVVAAFCDTGQDVFAVPCCILSSVCQMPDYRTVTTCATLCIACCATFCSVCCAKLYTACCATFRTA